MEKNNTSTGLGVSGVLTIVFVVLKLIKVINWSWWWVLSPLWIDLGLVLIIVLIVVVFKILREHRNR